MPETSSEPIAGDVRDYDWVDVGTLVVEVESDGEVWYETYEFVEAEKEAED